MKKYIWLVVICFWFGVSNIKAETYYLPDTHTYYQRSQHTYTHFKDGVLKSGYHPAIYTIIKNENLAKDTGVWDFFSYYKFPWTTEERNYFVSYCAGLPVKIKTMSAYNLVDIKSSTFIREEAKDYVKGILKHSYPFIKEEAMIKELMNANVLVSVETENGTFVTAKTNSKPTRSVNTDELLAATQLAIYSYTDPTLIDKVYSYTEVLKGYTVSRRAGVWKNTYDVDGYYEEVDNNIKAIYDYLTKKSEAIYNPVEIKNIMANEKNELYIALSNKKDNTNNLSFIISQDDTKSSEYKLKGLNKDNNSNYIVPLNENIDIDKIKIGLKGSVYKESEAYVFEAVDGQEASQTLVTLLSSDIPINTTYKGKITTFLSGDNLKTNPKTLDFNISILISSALVALIIVVYSVFKIYGIKNKEKNM